MRESWDEDELQDNERDTIALLRAYNAADGELDDAARVILGNADLPALAESLLGVAYALAVEYAREVGHTTGDEVRAAIEQQLASLQSAVLADPEMLRRDDGDEPAGG